MTSLVVTGQRQSSLPSYNGNEAAEETVRDEVAVPGGVDFSNCEPQDDGLCCVVKDEEVKGIEKEPILECVRYK